MWNVSPIFFVGRGAVFDLPDAAEDHRRIRLSDGEGSQCTNSYDALDTRFCVMPDYRKQAREYHALIAEVLMREWDPIGVKDFPDASDEYDSYVGPVFARLIRHEPIREVFEYLWWAETKNMELRGNRAHTMAVAERLVKLRESIEQERQNRALPRGGGGTGAS